MNATEFGKWVTEAFIAETEMSIPDPQIGLDRDPETDELFDAIDVHWQEKSFELLATFPVKEGELITFYGDDHGKTLTIKGRFPVDKGVTRMVHVLKFLAGLK